jgi:rod shape-determining protein MreD
VSWSFRSKFRSIEIVTGPAFWPSVGWVVVALVVQSLFARQLSFRHAIPSFVTIAVVLYALRVGARRGALLGIVAGALSDAVAGTGGGWTIADTTTAFAVGTVARGFFADGVLPPSFLVALAVIFRDAIFWLVMAMEGYPRGYGTTHLHATLWQALLTGLCTLVYLVARNRYTPHTRIERYS